MNLKNFKIPLLLVAFSALACQIQTLLPQQVNVTNEGVERNRPHSPKQESERVPATRVGVDELELPVMYYSRGVGSRSSPIRRRVKRRH